MVFDPVVLSRAQFGANITFHILFPTITIALAWILLFFKLRYNATGKAHWMEAYALWVKVFALTFALGVVTGVTMSFQFGTNWPGFMQTVGNIAGPLLIMKTDGTLQMKAIDWARRSLWVAGVGVAAISAVTPLISPRIFEKWFAISDFCLLLPIPLATAGLFFIANRTLGRLPTRLATGNTYGMWVPFACAVGVFFLSFYGLAYSLFPYLVLDQITVWQAASHPDSLKFILWGVVVVLPAILGYTVYAYRVFWGKAEGLSYQ